MTLVWRPDYNGTPGKVTLAQEFTWNESVWNPSMVGPSLWLDAADASTITEVGGAVSQWNDKSGNSRHAVQATVANQPFYTASSLINSKPAIDFTTDRVTTLTTPTIPNNSIVGSLPISVFGVFYNRLSDSSFQSPIGARSGGGTWWTFMRPISGQMEIGFHDASQRWSGVYSTNQSALISWSVDSSNLLNTYLDGSLIQTAFSLNSFGTQIDSSMRIGAGSSSSLSEDYEGLIGEIVFLTSEISTADRQKLEGYLAHKWGLTANLPNDHPYKLVGPTP